MRGSVPERSSRCAATLPSRTKRLMFRPSCTWKSSRGPEGCGAGAVAAAPSSHEATTMAEADCNTAIVCTDGYPSKYPAEIPRVAKHGRHSGRPPPLPRRLETIHDADGRVASGDAAAVEGQCRIRRTVTREARMFIRESWIQAS